MDAPYEYMDEESIDSDMMCSICQSPFDDPCCTPCGETFCRKCITHWIQTRNASCPLCREPLSENVFTQPTRMVRNMLDRLRVKCITCRHAEIQRGNFDDHIQKVCPKRVVSCPSADIKCPWTGQRDQLNQHLVDCRFEPMRPTITQLIAENQQLKEQVNTCQRENQQLNDQLKQKDTQISSINSQLRESITIYF